MRLEFLLINYQFIYTYSVYNFSYVLIFFFYKIHTKVSQTMASNTFSTFIKLFITSNSVERTTYYVLNVEK